MPDKDAAMGKQPECLSLASIEADLRARGRMGIKPGIERTARVLHALGDPQRTLGGALVAGTNGKGSVCALVQQALTSAGLRVGTMPKPPLHALNERICVDGVPLSNEAFIQLYSEVARAVAGEDPDDRVTKFELLTVVGFYALRHSAVDITVCEVGLGGVHDATSVLDCRVKAVTNVAADHLDIIGPTLAHVAQEKLGIVKSGDFVTLGPVPVEVVPIRDSLLEEVGPVASWLVGRDIHVVSRAKHWHGWEIDVQTPAGAILDLPLALLGDHQPVNAAVAIGVLAQLEQAYGIRVGEAAIRSAFAAAHWEGRMEWWALGDRRVMVDGAHNPAGVHAFALSLDRLLQPDGGRVAAVFAALRDKDWRAMIDEIPRWWTLVLTEVPSERALSCEEALAYATAQGRQAHAVSDIDLALQFGLDACGAGGVVAGFGTLVLVAELRRHCMTVVGR